MVPDVHEQADVTAMLVSQGMWASYNVPFFEQIYNTSGAPGAGRGLWNALCSFRKFVHSVSHQAWQAMTTGARSGTTGASVHQMRSGS